MTTEAPLNSSPTKTLSNWWKNFKSDDQTEGDTSPTRPRLNRSSASAFDVNQAAKRFEPTQEFNESTIFGVPLSLSLDTASVKIRLTDKDGESFIYGHIPVVIAKCAVYLKQTGRDIEGIFRIPGSIRRIKVLQELFNTPPDFGRSLHWDGFTQHDAANLLKRYLAMLPDPVIPRGRYDAFRDPLKQQFPDIIEYYREVEANNGHTDNLKVSPLGEDRIDKALMIYQSLIYALPRSSRQLLLYLIDLISVFSANSEQNRMTNYNLTAIFQPSLLTIKEHDMSPEEAQVSRAVLQFLTENSARLLKYVQDRAIRQHELLKKQSPDTPISTTDDGASDEEYQSQWKQSILQTPTLLEPGSDNSATTTPSMRATTPMDSQKFQLFPPQPINLGTRRHSKSVSSAQTPALSLNNEQDNNSKLAFLKKPLGGLRSRSNSRTDKEAESAPIPRPQPQGEDEERKSKFRRSLMVLLPGTSPLSSPTEERPEMKRNGSWFARLTDRSGETNDE